MRENLYKAHIQYTIPCSSIPLFGAFFSRSNDEIENGMAEGREREQNERNEDCQQSTVTATEYQKYKKTADC